MKEIKEKYLPIGTVVILKGATKRLMIAGFCAIDNSNKEKIWDYSGCMYPEGFLTADQICLFNHDQIEKVYHIGLSNDAEEKEFKKTLNTFMNEFEKINQEMKKQVDIKETKKKKTKKTSTSTTKKTTSKKKETTSKKAKTTKKKA